MRIKSRYSPLLVGGLILVVVLAIFGLVVLARPSVPRVEPVTRQPAAAQPTLTPAPAVLTAVPTVASTPVATPVSVSTTTAPSSATSEPTSRTLVVAPTGTPQAIDVQLAPAPSPTPFGWWDVTNQFDASLDAQVRAAYTHYWQERVDAAFNLDRSLLPQVEANPWLTAEMSVLDNMVAANTARTVVANHNLRVRYATNSEALVLDDYTLHVQSVDPDTKQPLSDDGSTSYHTVTRMQKLDGAWKAVDEVQVTRS
jgi:hypothetical protein